MKNKEILKDIYKENKAINRNMERVINIGFALMFTRFMQTADEKGDKREKILARGGLVLVAVLNLLTLIGNWMDYKKENWAE